MRAFDSFRYEFNHHRPHEALDDLTPAACYQAGTRPYPRRVPELEYSDQFEVRRVSQQGSIRWRGERTFISEIFRHETLGLKYIDGRWLQVFFGPVSLGWFDGYRHRFTRLLPRELKKSEPS